VRNAVINNFNTPELRVDTGALWGNFLVSERAKWLINNQRFATRYFWRTTQQQEIDSLEEQDGVLSAFEFKWNALAPASFPKTFLHAYPNAQTKLITPENYLTFVAA
jgi:hypothetical protein